MTLHTRATPKDLCSLFLRSFVWPTAPPIFSRRLCWICSRAPHDWPTSPCADAGVYLLEIFARVAQRQVLAEGLEAGRREDKKLVMSRRFLCTLLSRPPLPVSLSRCSTREYLPLLFFSASFDTQNLPCRCPVQYHGPVGSKFFFELMHGVCPQENYLTNLSSQLFTDVRNSIFVSALVAK